MPRNSVKVDIFFEETRLVAGSEAGREVLGKDVEQFDSFEEALARVKEVNKEPLFVMAFPYKNPSLYGPDHRMKPCHVTFLTRS